MTTRLISIEAENIKRLQAVEIHLNDGVTVIGGRNGQGKSSLLDAVEMALAGSRKIPKQPIRDGAESGHIILELDDLTVIRKFTPKGTTIVVESKDGARFKSPQSMLDKLFASLCFDPVDFMRKSPKEQAEMLEQIAGIDTTELDQQHQRIFDERTGVNRDVKSAEAALRQMTAPDEDTPDDLRDASEIFSKIEEAQQTISDNRARMVEIRGIVEQANQEKGRMLELEAELKRLQENRQQMAPKLSEAKAESDQLKAACHEAHESIPTLKQDLADIEDINQRVREKQAYTQAQQRLTAAQEQSQALTDQLTEIEQAKAELRSQAEYPVDGLGVTDERVVTYKGVPFDQASGAEKIRVSAAMGLALNPELRLLLIRDGSLLDDESMQQLRDFADENEAQILIERVGTDDPCAVIIEDGSVVPAEAVAT